MEKEYVLSLSYGKDSLACLEACKRLGIKIDRVVHAEVWATDDIPADLPPMVEFKEKADRIIKDRYGLQVEHVWASRGGQRHHIQPSSIRKLRRENILERYTDSPVLLNLGATANLKLILSKITYEKMFCRYNKVKQQIYGFPMRKGNYCTGLKTKAIPNNKEVISILGIAADESERIERHTKEDVILPLVEIGWTEADCYKWCEENDLLSPIYKDSMRGGCWFCHNQGVNQLRLLRKNYPEYWALLMKWDLDSPVTFHADGHTVHDFDKRFQMEDDGLIDPNKRWYWRYLNEV